MYSSVEELARTLQLRNPTAEQTAALTRVLTAATVEVDHEINVGEDSEPLSTDELELATQVALQRAAELWGLQEVPLGLAGIASEFGPAHLARNSWEKYAFTLAAIKRSYGIA